MLFIFEDGHSQVLKRYGHVDMNPVRQKGNVVYYNFYDKGKVKISMGRGTTEKQKDFFLINTKKIVPGLLSPETTKKGKYYVTISLDNIRLYEYKLSNKNYLIFQTGYAGASGKQANYAIFIVFEIISASKIKMHMYESYDGKIGDFSVSSHGNSIVLKARSYDGKQKSFVAN
jgi:hypothetical protein